MPSGRPPTPGRAKPWPGDLPHRPHDSMAVGLPRWPAPRAGQPPSRAGRLALRVPDGRIRCAAERGHPGWTRPVRRAERPPRQIGPMRPMTGPARCIEPAMHRAGLRRRGCRLLPQKPDTAPKHIKPRHNETTDAPSDTPPPSPASEDRAKPGLRRCGRVAPSTARAHRRRQDRAIMPKCQQRARIPPASSPRTLAPALRRRQRRRRLQAEPERSGPNRPNPSRT